MDDDIQLVDCPHYDDSPDNRCGLPSEVIMRGTWASTDGPVEAMLIKCVVGHWFNGPVEMLTY
jgi:hypothetical protein